MRNLSERADSAAIIKAVAAMSASLGMDTTVEGVETAEQLDRVRLEGCTEVQGYFYSSPRPACDLPGLIAALSIGERMAG